MDIRPQDLPELRAEIVNYNESARGVAYWGRRSFDPASYCPEPDGTVLVVDPYPEVRRATECYRLRDSELYFVSDDMTELAESAGRSLPKFQIEEHDVPSPHGFMVFAHPLHEILEEQDGTCAYIQAASWSVARNPQMGTSLWLSIYANLGHTPDVGADMAAPKWWYAVDCEWSFGTKDDRAYPEHSPLSIWGPSVIAAWLLMMQPLAVVSEVEPDRAARKRLHRINQDPAAVRVIELRRPKHSGGEPGESGREYHHRWITRGHWRQQWYATRQVHRPVWIAPHVKGPEGAPMIGGEKVYVWKR
jgi:hypothetical protein